MGGLDALHRLERLRDDVLRARRRSRGASSDGNHEDGKQQGEAARRLKDEGYEFRLKFVGDGPERQQLENLTAVSGLRERAFARSVGPPGRGARASTRPSPC